jgi:hypothetical protein
MFFVDSDIRLRQDTFTKLFDGNFPIVSGLYRSRSPPFQLTAKVNGNPVGDDIITWKNAASIQVHEIPMGCVLIDRRVFLRMAAKINEWQCIVDHRADTGREVATYSDKDARENGWRCKICGKNLLTYFFQSRIGVKGALSDAVSEDYYFSRQAASMGFPLYVRNDAFVEHYAALGDWHIAERGPVTTSSATGLVG